MNVNTCVTQVLRNNRIHSHPQTHSFNKCCLLIYYMPGTVPSVGNTAVSMRNMIGPCSPGIYIVGKQRVNKKQTNKENNRWLC